MPGPDDEARRLREDGAADRDDAARRDLTGPDEGAPCVAARTTTLSSYPTTAACFFAVQPVTVLGAEVEGGPGSTSVSSATFFALNLGATVPPVGTTVVCHYVGDRWVFAYYG